VQEGLQVIHSTPDMTDMTEMEEMSLFEAALANIDMTPTTPQKVGVISLIMAITGQNKARASTTLTNLKQKVDLQGKTFYDVFTDLETHVFLNTRNQVQMVASLTEAFQIIQMLPGVTAQSFCMRTAKVMTRVFAGDQNLHHVIDACGQSEGFLNKIARDEIEGDYNMVIKTDEKKYGAKMLEVNGGYELAVTKYNYEIHTLNKSMKYGVEDRANAFRISTDHANENHTLVQNRMLKLNKEQYDMCMSFVGTEEAKAELRVKFQDMMTDILNDNLDQHSTKRLLSSRGVQDDDGLVSLTVDHAIAKQVIVQNKKMKKTEELQQKKAKAEEDKKNKERTKRMQADTDYNIKMSIMESRRRF
jgi:hypothetical protein